MENQNHQPAAPQTEAHSMPRQPYAPPKAIFVPLKLVEGLRAGAIAGLIESCNRSAYARGEWK